MTRGPRARDSDVVHMSVRYRPSSDVLVAQVDDVSDPAVQRDKPDADTVIEWVRRPDGTRHIVGLQVLFAAARATQGRLSPSIPDALDARLRPIVRSLAGLDTTDFMLGGPDSPGASPSPGDPLSRSDLNLEVPADELDMPSDLDDPNLVDLFSLSRSITSEPVGASHAAGVARVLVDLATAIGDSANDPDPAPTTRLTTVLRELASTVAASGGLAAPGCSAAARVATRGGTPLTAGERTTLATLLEQLDNPEQWPDAIVGLQQLTDRLRGGSHR